MLLTIKRDDLSGAAIQALLQEHLRHMHSLSPPESVHALDLSGLKHPAVTFWTIWDGDELVGCGALKALDARHGEVKSMRTTASRRRTGAGRAMLAHILAEAQARGYARLSLETGSMDAFAPARTLYASHGFVECAPFGDYREDPNSTFMTKVL